MDYAGVDLICPYRHPKGTIGGMTPQKDGKTLKCGKCGHMQMPVNPDFQCNCHKCKRKRRGA